MNRRRLLGLTGGAIAGALASPGILSAQSGAWPTRGSIRLIAQFPPGGLVDTVSRLMAPALSQALGQTVVVENRAGAGGVIGTDFVAKQPADGARYSLEEQDGRVALHLELLADLLLNRAVDCARGRAAEAAAAAAAAVQSRFRQLPGGYRN